MSPSETLSPLEIQQLWQTIMACPTQRGMSLGAMMMIMKKEHPWRLSFEVGALRDPGRHLTLVATEV